MKRVKNLLVPLAIGLIVCGCATDQKFRIETKQPGARITLDDIDVGAAPCEVTLSVNGNGVVRGGSRLIKAYPMSSGQYVQQVRVSRVREVVDPNTARTIYLDLDLAPVDSRRVIKFE